MGKRLPLFKIRQLKQTITTYTSVYLNPALSISRKKLLNQKVN